jgi:hypothetical protein
VTYKSRFDVNFMTEVGANLFSILKKRPPFCPSKRRDYLIALKIFMFQKRGTYKEIKQLGFVEEPYFVNLIATLFLMYSTSNQTDSTTGIQKRSKSLEDWLNYLGFPWHGDPARLPWGPDLYQRIRAQGLRLGQILLQPIEQNVMSLCNYLSKTCRQLPEAYIVGYFIGDGSLTMSIWFSPTFNKLNTQPCCGFYETTKNIPLLYAIQRTFGVGAVTFKQGNVHNYRIMGNKGCLASIIPLLDKYQLPRGRQLQFTTFKRSVHITDHNLHLLEKGFYALLDLCWDSHNYGKRRMVTKQEMIRRAQIYFSSKEKVERNKITTVKPRFRALFQSI